MSSVAAVSPHDLWAVGHQDSTSGGMPLIEHWTGAAWKLVSSPNVNSGYLLGVSAFRADDIWAVGLTLGSVSYSLIEHWNGRRWTVVTSPNPSADYNEIDSVVAISGRSAWAVGFSVSNNASVPMLARWDGSSWTLVASPATSQPSNLLRSVAAASERDVWAVGQSASADGSQIQTLVEHWNGRVWSVVGSPSPSSQTWLNAVAVAGDQVLAVGVQVAGFTNQTLVVRGAAGQFTAVPSPDRGTGGNTLESVTAAPDGISWAVGFDQGQTKGESLILRVCSA
jgi:hypothetical protein